MLDNPTAAVVIIYVVVALIFHVELYQFERRQPYPRQDLAAVASWLWPATMVWALCRVVLREVGV